MDDLKRKKTNLKKTQGKVKLHERKLAVLKKQATILQKREHLKKIYAAGQIIDNVGILNNYDKVKLYDLLISNKNSVIRK